LAVAAELRRSVDAEHHVVEAPACAVPQAKTSMALRLRVRRLPTQGCTHGTLLEDTNAISDDFIILSSIF